MVILAVVIFDTAQNYQFYTYQRNCQHVQQGLYNKHYIIAKISSSVIGLALMNQGLLSTDYGNFTHRASVLREKLLIDIDTLDELENTIQDSPGSTSVGMYRIKSSGTNSFDPNP